MPAVAQPVIAIQAKDDLEVLEFIESVEADNVTGLAAIKRSNAVVKYVKYVNVDINKTKCRCSTDLRFLHLPSLPAINTNYPPTLS